jgi:Flp pilus assembly protein TadD
VAIVFAAAAAASEVPPPPAGAPVVPPDAAEEARALARDGDARARDRYRDAIREAPSDVALRVEFAEYLWNAGDTAEAQAQMDWLLQNAHPREGFRRYYGLKLFDAGNFEKAARVLAEASREGPADADLSFCLGASRLETGDFPGAESALRRAIELSPGNAAALRLLGRLLHLTGRIEESTAVLRRAADADPASAETWLDLAQALADAGEQPEAERACRLSIERRGDRAASHLTLAKVLRAEGRKDESDAEFAASRALYDQEEERTQEARATLARVSRGWELLALNQPAEALARFESAPGSASAWKGRAEALRRLGRREDAIDALEHARTLAPDDHSIDYAIERLRSGPRNETP